jgi:hypothetical protein
MSKKLGFCLHLPLLPPLPILLLIGRRKFYKVIGESTAVICWWFVWKPFGTCVIEGGGELEGRTLAGSLCWLPWGAAVFGYSGKK